MGRLGQLAILVLVCFPALSQEIKINSTGVLPLSGDWEFVWNRLLTPDDFQKSLGDTLLHVPGSWIDIGHPDTGIGTYRVKIRLNETMPSHSILIPIINSTAKVWLNGKLVDELGVCDVDPAKYRAKFSSLLIAVPADTTMIELVVQVINYSYSRGGIVSAPYIGPTSVILQRVNARKGVENFFVGSLIAMFVYQIILFFLYQKGKPYLYLGLICLIVALRALVTHGGSFLLPDLYPSISLDFWKKMEYFVVYAVAAIFPLYSYYLFPMQAYRKPIPFFVTMSTLLCLVVVFTPHAIYSRVLDVCHLLLIAGFAYSVAVITKAWRAGNKDASIILLGVLASFPFILLEILQNSRVLFISISFPFLVELGVLIFLLFQVYLLANHYAVAYKKLEMVNIELEAKVQARTTELTKANQVREKLLSVVSHDLKSPLNSLRGVLNIYHKGGFTDQEMKSVTRDITENLSTTSMLVDNILLWTSSQLKGVKVSISKVNLHKLVEEHFKIFKNIAEHKNIELISDVPEMEIYSDEQILSLVLRNLIANAIKFSYENGRVEIYARRDEQSFSLRIKDNGKGMPAEVAQTLFHAKSTVSTEGTSSEKGTGIGLGLCYDYLKHIGGEIAVQSELEKGTTFTIHIPLGK
ncbi:sensor histidine kinase [Cytophagales bacterium WSM2-2]|nr:sensor histidine kinase [Cytophagales bacterium WSM2-2]